MSKNTVGNIETTAPVSGEFYIHKEGKGKARVRAIGFRTFDGHVGLSKGWNRDEAYRNAVKIRDEELAKQAECPKMPAPVAPVVVLKEKPLSEYDEESLMAELERRGWAITTPELLGIDANGDPVVIAPAPLPLPSVEVMSLELEAQGYVVTTAEVMAQAQAAFDLVKEVGRG